MLSFHEAIVDITFFLEINFEVKDFFLEKINTSNSQKSICLCILYLINMYYSFSVKSYWFSFFSYFPNKILIIMATSKAFLGLI